MGDSAHTKITGLHDVYAPGARLMCWNPTVIFNAKDIFKLNYPRAQLVIDNDWLEVHKARHPKYTNLTAIKTQHGVISIARGVVCIVTLETGRRRKSDPPHTRFLNMRILDTPIDFRLHIEDARLNFKLI